MTASVVKLFAEERRLLGLSQDWARKADQYDHYAELATNEMIDKKDDQEVLFTVGKYQEYMDVIRDNQELAYLARLRSCVYYRKYTKVRRKREMIVRDTIAPRHRRRSK